ncbi:NAD(P)H-hydrate epimerase, partial [Paenibacillus senegalensis]|uniref:NAD(P)H-hydrate epimerase n=1 Tax=Paenibacillus senegalensis TaxID=1465766 RepID=UPI0002890B16
MYVLNSEEMRRVDQYTIEQIGIPALVLMENAGRAVAEEVLALSRELPSRTGRWLIMAGKGNNGGDGLVAARHLLEAGCTVDIWLAEEEDKGSEAMSIQQAIIKQLGLALRSFQPGQIMWGRYDGAIDALLGTGTRGQPRDTYAAFIREANESGLPIVAVDIPSGLDADTGQLHDPCIRAKLTVALAFTKRGLVQHPGVDAAGRVVVRPIGIPERLAADQEVNTLLL